jgi:superfamily II DNA or RNA helicase
MSFVIKKGKKKIDKTQDIEEADQGPKECKDPSKKYSKKCSTNGKLLQTENENRIDLAEHPDDNLFLYPTLNDPNFNKKIAEKKEFSDTKYDGTIYNVKEYADILSQAEFELLPQQAFVRNFMSFQTPYNSLLLFHGLGSGKTCSAIGVCEEMRDYLKQMGINKPIIIVASPNVQDNFKLQLFDERKLKEVDGIWTIKGCLGNKLLKEINPTGMKGLKKDKIIQQAKSLINSSYQFVGYLQFSNEIVRNANLDNPEVSQETKIRNLQNIYNNSLIVIDEVHNIRIADDNENKNVAKNLTYLVNVVDNLRLLLLSATPMFNSYKEIIWLINLMNMNDRRGIVGVSDIFDKNGEFKIDKDGNEIGKDMLIRKVTGYVSYVRGENPYSFPFRVYPDQFAPDHTFKVDSEYPKCQINGTAIPEDRKIQKLSLYLTKIGSYQELGYKYIVDRLRARPATSKPTRTGKIKNMPSFGSLASFGYTDLMNPIEALNIVFPLLNGELEELTKDMVDIECQDVEEENVIDIAPSLQGKETDDVEEIDEVLSVGPKPEKSVKALSIAPLNAELESEPAVTEGLDADPALFDEVVELDANRVSSLNKENPEKSKISKKSNKLNKTKEELLFDEVVEYPVLNPVEEVKPVIKKPETSFSKSIIPGSKEKEKEKKTTSSNLHVIEGETESRLPTELNPVKQSSLTGLSVAKSKSKSDPDATQKSLEDYLSSVGSLSSKESKGGAKTSAKRKLFINPKELTGTEGLKRIMNYTDSKTPAVKGAFEYREGAPQIFKPDQIGKYSAKIKNVCDSIYAPDTGNVAEGIILIYSAYIDAGIIPMALALEEMGFTRYSGSGNKARSLFKAPPSPVVDVRTMRPPSNRKDFKPARYVIITGDPRISPDNDGDVKAITSDDNIFAQGPAGTAFAKDEKGNKIDISGSKIKVVLISQAGSEGLDFKAIRQIHILEPWYNMNRNEQIIGRGVRNFSHKDLPFEKRNVQIFLYGTILKNALEEAADLYVYRISEIKAVKIGKVTRLLKETAVDCIINHDQTEFTPENFKQIPENAHVEQMLSTGIEIEDFQIGDLPNSATCDYMESCEFKCLPLIKESGEEGEEDESGFKLNYDTYNEAFMLVNSDKIIQKVKALMKDKFFYKKMDLFQLINKNKKYPTVQIYAALTQIINDNTEYISDKYGRTGYLVNIGDYYLFQPSELNFKNISIYDRSVPIDYKHNKIQFEMQNIAAKPVIDKRLLNEKLLGELVEVEDFARGKEILTSMFSNFILATSTKSIERGNKNWYELCGIVMRKMIETEGLDKNTLIKFVVEHIVDTLMLPDRIDLMNYIWASPKFFTIQEDANFKFFSKNVQKYLQSKIIVYKKITAVVIYDGPSSINSMQVFTLNGKEWLPAEPEDKRTLSSEINRKYRLKGKENLNAYVGFIGFENARKYMVYKVKDTTNERSLGYRCDQAAKDKVIDVLNEIEGSERFSNKDTKDSAIELCVRQELTLRNKQKEDDGTIWFLDTETAIYNEFEKKDKDKK